MGKVETKSFSVQITIERAADLPGRWEAHCLEVDVVSYGTDPRDAFRMVEEATVLVIVDDLNHDRDPLARGAPEENWVRLQSVLSKAKKVPLDTLDGEPTGETVFVISMRLSFHRKAGAPLAKVIDIATWTPKQDRVLGLDRARPEPSAGAVR
jgi:hypothetical protein